MHYHWIGIAAPKGNCKMGPSELLMLCTERLLKGVQPFLLPNAFPMQITWPSRAAAVINAYQRHPLSLGADKSLTKIFRIAPRAFFSKRNKVRQRQKERKNENAARQSWQSLCASSTQTHSHTHAYALYTLGVKALKGTVNSSMRLCTVSTNGI